MSNDILAEITVFCPNHATFYPRDPLLHSGPKLAFGTHLAGDGDPLSETISKSVQISVLMWQIFGLTGFRML